MKLIVMLGNIQTGFTFHGPFDDEELADKWAEVEAEDEEYTVVPLAAPVEFGAPMGEG